MQRVITSSYQKHSSLSKLVLYFESRKCLCLFVLFRLKSPNFSYKKWKHLPTNSQDIDLIPVSVPLHEDTQYYRWELDDDNNLLRPLADSIID